MQTRNQTPETRTQKHVDEIVADFQDKPGALLSILEKIQNDDEHNHLSEESLRAVTKATGEPLSRIYSIVTFYSYFNLTPQGKHTIVVCRGTACHTRGSLALLKDTMSQLGAADFKEEEEPTFTTTDRFFTVRTVACFGQCALSPVVAIDGIIYSRISSEKLSSLIQKIYKEHPTSQHSGRSFKESQK